MFVIYILLGIVNIQFGDCKYPVFYGRLPFWGSAQLHQKISNIFGIRPITSKISNIFGNYAQINQQISYIFGTYAQIHQQICKYLFGECQLPNYTNCNYICMCFFGRLPFWGSAQLHKKNHKKNYQITTYWVHPSNYQITTYWVHPSNYQNTTYWVHPFPFCRLT